MAVSVIELAVALRLSADGTDLAAAQTAVLERLLGVGAAMVGLLVPTAPEAIQDECIIRLGSYLYSQPVGRRDAFSHSWINSGAGSLASNWHQQAASGEHDTPTTITGGLTLAQVQSLIATHRDITAAHHDPAMGMGGPGEDQTARDAAATAQAAADGAQGEIDTHEGSTHNVDSTARSEALAAQGLITGHEVATAPHNDAIAELIEAHRLVSDSHHTPGMGGVGGLTAAAAAQADLDAHEATQHNHDAGARTAAANAQITAESVRDAAAAAQSDADTAQTTAGQAQATATAAQADIDSHEANHPGGGGTPPTVLYEGTATLAAGSAKLPGEIVCPQTGFLEIYLEATAGNRSNSVGSLKAPAARVYAANAAIGATYNGNGTTNNIMAIPLGANRAAHISANATDHHIAMGSPDAGSAGDYYVRIALT